MSEGIPYTGGVAAGFSGSFKEYGQFPPPAALGVYYLVSGGWPRYESNRSVYAIQPWASEADRKHGVYRSAQEYFALRVDPLNQWIEAAKPETSAVHFFGRAFGNPGDNRRFFDAGEVLRALDSGHDWLVDDFIDAAGNLAAGGRTVVCHLGGIDSAMYAKRYIDAGQQAELLGNLALIYVPLLSAGVDVVIDALSGEAEDTVGAAFAKLLAAMQRPPIIESTPDLASTWLHGLAAICTWPTFRDRHVNQAAWAVGKWAKLGTADFTRTVDKCYVDLMAAYFAEPDNTTFWNSQGVKDDARIRRIVGRMQAASKTLAAAGVKPLIDDVTCTECVRLGIKAKEFLPQ